MKKLFLSGTAAALITVIVTVLLTSQAMAFSIEITEWMYKGEGAEFIEFTNTGDTAVDFTGFYFEDDHYQDGESYPFDLSGFGIVAAGESVILTEEETAEFFREDWGLDASVKVIAGLGETAGKNIGGSDTINLLDAAGNLIDTLAYEKDTIQASGASGNPETMAALSETLAAHWVLAEVDDVYGSWESAVGDIGNPGTFSAPGAVPVPGSLLLLGAGLCSLAGLCRREKHVSSITATADQIC